MPNNILKSTFIIILGGLLGYSSVKYFFSSDVKPNRLIASAPVGKLKHTINTNLYYDVKIDADHISQNDHDSSQIQIFLTARRNFDAGLRYQWSLPQDAIIVSGSTDGDLGAFTKNQTKSFILQLKNFSKQQKKYLIFQISGQLEQRPAKQDLLISSRIEDSFEHQIQQNAKKPASEDQKVQGNSNRRKFNLDNVIR